MKNKGFTLIELLAVIVILAIIALIATPIILGIINDARDEARKRSAEAVTHAVETAYITALMKQEQTGERVALTPANIVTVAKVDNATKDGATISTDDGVDCELTGTESAGFTLTCTHDSANVKTTNLATN